MGTPFNKDKQDHKDLWFGSSPMQAGNSTGDNFLDRWKFNDILPTSDSEVDPGVGDDDEDDQRTEFLKSSNGSTTNADNSIDKIAPIIVDLSTFIAENFLSHPYIVLRRQCQIQPRPSWYHLQPFTLIPVAASIYSHQGPAVAWKGLSSTFLLRGLHMLVESVAGEVFRLPREVSADSSSRRFAEHLILKAISMALITPFQAAVVCETIRSGLIFDGAPMYQCFIIGAQRVWCSGLRIFGGPLSGPSRLLSVQWLLGPAVAHGVLHYIVATSAQSFFVRRLRREQEASAYYRARSSSSSARSRSHQPAQNDPALLFSKCFPDLIASYLGHLCAEAALYPLETVVHSLMVQGTRTIVDNMDNGVEVASISTQYDGFFDCVSTISREQGLLGFYKGFGAVIIQFALGVLSRFS